jgi:hypothetical protein
MSWIINNISKVRLWCNLVQPIIAIITHCLLPTIKGDEQLKIQLFQNIIANAIKYRSQETPKIHISATKEKNHYIFSIKDNWIGMSPKPLEKIFTIFQRLHTRRIWRNWNRTCNYTKDSSTTRWTNLGWIRTRKRYNILLYYTNQVINSN